jgi:hypothetical protein
VQFINQVDFSQLTTPLGQPRWGLHRSPANPCKCQNSLVGVPLGTNKINHKCLFTSNGQFINKVDLSPRFAADNSVAEQTPTKCQSPLVGVPGNRSYLGTNKSTTDVDLKSPCPLRNQVDCSQLKQLLRNTNAPPLSEFPVTGLIQGRKNQPQMLI